jgi:hypothetical protein
MTAQMQTADMTATHATIRHRHVPKLLFSSLDLLDDFMEVKVI